MREHPVVADVIEASLDVAFQRPLRRRFLRQRQKALFDGVRGGALRAKAVGIGIGLRFRNGQKREQVKSLHRAILHRRNAEGPQLSISFGNVDPPQRRRLIAAPTQRMDRLAFARRGRPDCSVHPRRAFAFIFRDSSHGQGSTVKRVAQQPLQGFHLAPTTGLSALDDTRLQPVDEPLTLSPVDLAEVEWFTGRCTRGIFHAHLRFLPAQVRPALSSSTTRWKSAHFRGGEHLLSVRLQDGVCFFQHPLPAASIAILTDAPARHGQGIGFIMFWSSDTMGLVSVSYAGGLECPCVPRLAESNRPHHLLVEACQRHWLRPINDTCNGSLSLDLPISLSPYSINAIETTDHLTMIHTSKRGRDFVTAAFDPVVSNHANAARLRRTESPVLLMLLLIELLAHRTITGPSSFRTRRNRSKPGLELSAVGTVLGWRPNAVPTHPKRSGYLPLKTRDGLGSLGVRLGTTSHLLGGRM